MRVFSEAHQIMQPRQYTLSQAPGNSMLRISVKREPSGVVSTHLHQHVNAFDVVELASPSGLFTLKDVKSEHPLVFIAAGIGITPIVPMLETLAVENPMREVHFLYSTQDLKHYPLKKDVENALNGMPNAGKGIFFTNPGPDEHLGVDYDASGRFTLTNVRSFCQNPEAEFYVCGPVDFMKDAIKALTDVGVVADRIHTEMFGTGTLA